MEGVVWYAVGFRHLNERVFSNDDGVSMLVNIRWSCISFIR